MALLDLDPQGSTLFWASLREKSYPQVRKASFSDMARTLSKLDIAGFDYVFLDMPPTDKKQVLDCMLHADLVVIPTKASPLDIHSAMGVLEWAQHAAKHVAWAINGASVSSGMSEIVFDQLAQTAKVFKTIVHERNDFLVSIGLGLGVSEFAPGSKAACEIQALWKEARALCAKA